jgi:signal transduction histidine kinase
LNFLNAPAIHYHRGMDRTAVRGWLAGILGLGILITGVITNNAVVGHPELVLKTILETAVAIIGTLVTVLLFGRFRRSGDFGDLAITCSVALLAWVHTLFGTIPDLISPDSVGNGISERYEVWGTLVIRITAAGLLIAAARYHGRREHTTSRWSISSYLALLVVAAVGGLTTILLAWKVPIGRSGLLVRVSWPQSFSSLFQIVGAAVFLVAFVWLSQRARSDSDEFFSWIAVGCIFATFAMISYGLLPAGGANWLRCGDLLRAAAVCTWAVAAIIEIVNYWSSVAESARLKTRRAVALDLHDGLAQELALLSAYAFCSAEDRVSSQWGEELRLTAARALAEARRAITVLSTDEPMSFEADLSQTARDCSNADVDIRVEVDDKGSGMDLAHRESIVTIVREAVANAVRHGRAHNVNIRLGVENPPTLRVHDDGVGFDVAGSAHLGRCGLISMRETAEAIGGSLVVRSDPGNGTTVEVMWA